MLQFEADGNIHKEQINFSSKPVSLILLQRVHLGVPPKVYSS